MKSSCWLLAGAVLLSTALAFDVYEYAKCQLCETAKPSGAIEDCCCDVETVDQVNTRHFLPILHDLTKSTYFRYFKVDLWRSCPFWPDDGECAREECAVCECDEREVPACWREEETKERAAPSNTSTSDADEATDAKVAELSKVVYGAVAEQPGQSLSGVPGWSLEEGAPLSGRGKSAAAPGYDEANVWSVQAGGPASPSSPSSAPTPPEALQYVNLLDNPEGYTGYAGPKATRVWSAIYGENCFSGPLEGLCLEERVFYRLISGLQTSINTHIAMTYGSGEGNKGWDMYTQREEEGGGAGDVVGRAYTWLLNAVSLARGQGPFPSAPEAYAPGAAAAAAAAASSAGGGAASPAPRAPPGVAPATGPVTSQGTSHSLLLSPGLRPNVTLYHERIGRHPDRLKNLYFAFLFVLRAVAKAQPLLTSMHFSTGNASEDGHTRDAMVRLLQVEVPSVLAGFDESRMFKVSTSEFLAGGGGGQGTCPPVLHGLGDVHELQHRYLAHVERKAALREAFRDKYRNISLTLDCVGCEKCRMWGKLQFLGLGTAMKILFADADAMTTPVAGPYAGSARPREGEARGAGSGGGGNVHLSRNELVALINVLHRLSMSLAALHVMRDIQAREKLGEYLAQWGGVGVACGVLLLGALWWRGRGTGRGGGAGKSLPPSSPVHGVRAEGEGR